MSVHKLLLGCLSIKIVKNILIKKCENIHLMIQNDIEKK